MPSRPRRNFVKENATPSPRAPRVPSPFDRPAVWIRPATVLPAWQGTLRTPLKESADGSSPLLACGHPPYRLQRGAPCHYGCRNLQNTLPPLNKSHSASIPARANAARRLHRTATDPSAFVALLRQSQNMGECVCARARMYAVTPIPAKTVAVSLSLQAPPQQRDFVKENSHKTGCDEGGRAPPFSPDNGIPNDSLRLLADPANIFSTRHHLEFPGRHDPVRSPFWPRHGDGAPRLRICPEQHHNFLQLEDGLYRAGKVDSTSSMHAVWETGKHTRVQTVKDVFRCYSVL